jgi:hypothetical protein
MDYLAIFQEDNASLLISSKLGNDFDPNSRLDGLDPSAVPALFLHRPPLLSAASYFGARNCFLHLRMLGADVNQPDESPLHLRPVHFAVAGSQIELVNLLLCSKADGSGIVYAAVKFDAFPILTLALRLGCDSVDSSEFGKETPLELAVKRDAFAVAEILLMNGAHFAEALREWCRAQDRNDFVDLLDRYGEQRVE